MNLEQGAEKGGFRSRFIVRAAATAGIIVSAAALINIISHLFTLQLSGILFEVLTYYRNLFFPVLDFTLGKVLQLFNVYLNDIQKDLTILYLLISSSFGRMIYKNSDGKKKRGNWPLLVVMSLCFPIVVAVLLWIFFWEDGETSADASELLTKFAKEVLYVFLVAALALLLNAADVL